MSTREEEVGNDASPGNLTERLISIAFDELAKLPQLEREALLARYGSRLIRRDQTKGRMFEDPETGAQRGIDDLKTVSDDSLLYFYGNVYSQTGQDGILTEVFRRLDIKRGRFVEFGGWDGVYLSNCRWLSEKGWSGVFIEANENKFNKLCETYANTERIKCLKGFVGYSGDDNLLSFLSRVYDQRDINKIDLVNIDIDGLDLEVACSMGFKPKVLLLEGGSNFDPTLQKPFPKPQNDIQHPLGWIVKELREFGYEPVCFLQDIYAVRMDLADLVHPRARELSSQELYEDCYKFRGGVWRDFIDRKKQYLDSLKLF